MSERLSSVEIEDVLSSIRRLVSEDLRPGTKPGAAPAAAPAGGNPAETEPVAEDKAADKLILTPALRIGPETEAVVPAPEAAAPAFHSIRQGRGTSVVDQVTRAMPEEDWEPVAESAPAPRSDWASETEAAVEAAGAAWSEAPVAPVEQPADPTIGMDLPPDDTEMAGTDLREAEGWPAADAPEANWSAPGEQAPMEAEQPEDPGWSEVEPMAIDRPAAEGPDSAASQEEEGRSMAGPQDPDGMVDADAATDLPDWARMEAEAPAPEPDPIAAFTAAGPSAAPRQDAGWADAAEAEIRRQLEDDATATVFARFDDDDDHDERHFDEEMLRDLVRDILREELQGALGERITRNVRKLVRAEIARALAVRDFE